MSHGVLGSYLRRVARLLEPFWFLFWLPVIVWWGIGLYALLWISGPGGVLYLLGTLIVLYLRHPRKNEPEELDDKLPGERWIQGRERYIEEVRKRIVES